MYLRLFQLLILMLFASGCVNHKLVECKKQNQRLNADLTQVHQRLQEETAKHKADVDKLNKEVEKIQMDTNEVTRDLKQGELEQHKLRAEVAELEMRVKALSDENEKLRSNLADMEKKAKTETSTPPVQ